MSQKYTDARYPEKINDLIDNEGGLSEEGKSTINEITAFFFFFCKII